MTSRRIIVAQAETRIRPNAAISREFYVKSPSAAGGLGGRVDP